MQRLIVRSKVEECYGISVTEAHRIVTRCTSFLSGLHWMLRTAMEPACLDEEHQSVLQYQGFDWPIGSPLQITCGPFATAVSRSTRSECNRLKSAFVQSLPYTYQISDKFRNNCLCIEYLCFMSELYKKWSVSVTDYHKMLYEFIPLFWSMLKWKQFWNGNCHLQKNIYWIVYTFVSLLTKNFATHPSIIKV